jgi:hypothetical protein
MRKTDFRGGSPHARHRTARVHHAARRRGGDVAARGAGAAIEDAGAWISRQRVGGWLYEHGSCRPQRLERGRLCREAESSDRISLGEFSIRETACARGRAGQTSGRRNLCHRERGLRDRRQVGDGEHSDRVRKRQRPGPLQVGRDPQPAGRQCHRDNLHQQPAWTETHPVCSGF